MATVLCTGSDEALMASRKLLLEQAGHKVVLVTAEPQLLAACAEHTFDVVVIGQALHTNEKCRIFRLVREHCPTAKVLELSAVGVGERVLPQADDSLIPESDRTHVDAFVEKGQPPAVLLHEINELLGQT
jgi:CheY-like chemotaxis protein